MASLSEIRAKLLAASQQATSGTGADNAIYPHWNIAEGQTSTLRFLQDGDPANGYFWIERGMIKLPFAGVKGDALSKPVIVQVPCMEMWNEQCPILAEVRPWFKDKSLEEMGRKYWKKKSYLFQGFVVDSSLKEDKMPENPIRRFIISSQIFNIIKAALMDPDMEELPTDVIRGIDFKVSKTSKGGYADYSTSNWARRERTLSDVEQQAITQYGLHDLKSFLPKKPGPAELAAMVQMFEASVDGDAYDMERWGQFYKPAGLGDSNKGASPQTQAVAASPQPVESTPTTAPWVAETPDVETEPVSSTANNRAQDILAMIRNRQKT
jgi:hypothetical protein